MESALRQWACQQNIELIETLGWNGQSFAHLDAHISRIAHSANRLGFPLDTSTVADQLLRVTTNAPARVRMSLNCHGKTTLQSTPLGVAKKTWTVSLAKQRLRSNDPWLGVKSTYRPAYDAARAELADGLDEVILLNERGEVCDGSITTLFFDRGDGLRTPPLRCGVLPGVLRAKMACPEEVITPSELPHLRLWVGNSLRGLIRANWVDPARVFPVA